MRYEYRCVSCGRLEEFPERGDFVCPFCGDTLRRVWSAPHIDWPMENRGH